MTTARHCEACGARLGPAEGHVQRCPDCGHVRYEDLRPCGAALVVRGERELLLVRRGLEPWAGSWDIPGGHCDGREHPAVAARREVHEETGVEIRVTGLLGLWMSAAGSREGTGAGSLTAYYHALPTGSTATSASDGETLEAGWHPLDRLPQDIAFPGHQLAVLDAWRRASAAGEAVSPLRDLAGFDLPGRPVAATAPVRGTAPSAVLFDVGGVLLLPDDKRLARGLQQVGIRADAERAADAIFRASAEAARHDDPTAFWSQDIHASYARHAGVPPVDAGAAWEAVCEMDAAAPPLWTRRNGDVDAVLRALRARGLRLAIVSNANGMLRQELEALGLDEHFEAIVDSQSLGVAKPDARAFHSAIAALGGVHPSECWFVGDDPHYDLAGAAAAGIARTILLDRLGLHADAADHTRIADLHELVDLVDRELA